MAKLILFQGIATLMGTIIGAGILGLPYVIAKAGLFTGILEIVLLGMLFLCLNLMIGEVMLRTEGNHQLPGYAKIYLGKTGKFYMLIAMVIGIYGPLLAYMIGTGEALHAIFPAISPFVFSLIMFVVLSVLVFLGLKAVEESEFGMMFVIIAIILGISIWAFFSGKADVSYLQGFDLMKMAIPYGVVVFALMGAASLPEVKEELQNHKHLLRKAIIIGSLLPVLLYILFVIGVVAVTGASTTEVATIGLGQIMGPKMVMLGNLLAIFAMSTSFIALGLAMKEMYSFDLKIKKHWGWLLTCAVPLVLFLAGARSFIATISFAGAVSSGLMSLLIVFMFWEAKKLGQRKPEFEFKTGYWIGTVIIMVFLLGVVHQLWGLI